MDLKKINILDFFREFTSLKEEKKIGNEYYFAKNGQKTGSISVNPSKGFFYDHNDGVGGGILKAIELYYNGVDITNSFIPHEEINETQKKEIEIKYIGSVKNQNLLDFYANTRSLPMEYINLVSQINYVVNDKHFYTLGWINENDGINTQNSIIKRVFNKNGVTFINNKSGAKISLFESYFDYLAYLKDTNDLTTDVIVLNSTSLVNHINMDLSEYEIINTYFDNDRAGDKCTKIILEKYPDAKDKRFYEDDYNQYIIDKELEPRKSQKMRH